MARNACSKGNENSIKPKLRIVKNNPKRPPSKMVTELNKFADDLDKMIELIKRN
ncbi:MAG: hypothetical protein HRU19_26000 [Pseudobacteriovorax sp.]|nr:hypothetical protein [Pseudobacteriovorax sp.]